MKIILAFCGTLLMSLSQVMSWYNILGEKLYFNYRNKISFVLLSIFIFINHNFIPNYIKGLLTILIAFAFCKYIIRRSIRETILITFISQLLVIISESILVVICIGVLKIDPNLLSSVWMTFIFDILMSGLIVLISKVPFLKLLYSLLLRVTDSIKINQIFVFILFVALGTNIFGATLYFKNNYIVSLCFNIFISVIYTVIIFIIFKYQNKYYKINSKYNMSLENLKIQEQIINDYRIINHENKNQLLTIREITRSKKARNYIDTLINKKNKYNNKIINSIYKLPSGGIRGLVYNKLLLMDELNIKYNIIIDSKLSVNSFNNLDSNDMVDICQILGVFIDNAVEENSDSVNKQINIEFHYNTDKSITILIINFYDYKNKKFGKHGELKSSKDDNRGFGLKLVKNIINKNNKLSNNRSISKDTFTQELIIRQK